MYVAEKFYMYHIYCIYNLKDESSFAIIKNRIYYEIFRMLQEIQLCNINLYFLCNVN